MSDDEYFDEFYAKLNDIVNSAYNLGEIYNQPKNPTIPKDKEHDRPLCVCHFCGKIGHIRPNCFKLQATKRANKP